MCICVSHVIALLLAALFAVQYTLYVCFILFLVFRCYTHSHTRARARCLMQCRCHRCYCCCCAHFDGLSLCVLFRFNKIERSIYLFSYKEKKTHTNIPTCCSTTTTTTTMLHGLFGVTITVLTVCFRFSSCMYRYVSTETAARLSVVCIFSKQHAFS